MWWRNSEDEWENALLLFGGFLLLRHLGSGASIDTHAIAKRLGLEPSLPDGMRLPGSGDLREVPAYKTRIDPKGFPELYNQAFQIATSPTFALEDWLAAKDWVTLSPAVPRASEDYAAPAAVFAAHAAVETNNGDAVWNNNPGNVTTKRGDWYRLPQADAKDGTPHQFQSFNFPLQGAIEHVARINRLWPRAIRAAYPAPGIRALVSDYAHALQDGALKYAGSNVSADQLTAAIRARGAQLGVSNWLS